MASSSKTQVLVCALLFASALLVSSVEPTTSTHQTAKTATVETTSAETGDSKQFRPCRRGYYCCRFAGPSRCVRCCRRTTSSEDISTVEDKN